MELLFLIEFAVSKFLLCTKKTIYIELKLMKFLFLITCFKEGQDTFWMVKNIGRIIK